MVSLLIALHLSSITPLITYTIIGLCVAPLIAIIVSHIFTHLATVLASVTLGPHIQGVVGGVGSLLHEILQILVALLTGHNVKYTHLLTIQDFKNGHALGDTDHNWQSAHFGQSFGDFLLGTIPFFVMSYIIIKWQAILSGENPFTSVSHVGLNNYTSVSNCLSMVFSDFHSAFSGLNLFTDIIFIIGLFILGLYGLNTTINECDYVTRGTLIWIVALLILDLATIFGGFTVFTTSLSVWVLNFSCFIMARAIVYAIVFMIPIGILKIYSKVKSTL